jgi:transcriptional regulator NrdR family protein
MVCIYCQSETEVTNSRPKARTPSVWRRRACKVCVAQFTTMELPDYTTALAVRGLGGISLRPFSRDKLFLSLHKSLGHRPDALDSSTALCTTVIGRLLSKNQALDAIISVQFIAKVTYEVLRRYDPLGANTYKAYHLDALRG